MKKIKKVENKGKKINNKPEKELNANTKWDEVLKDIREGTFLKNYKDYFINKKENGYHIYNKDVKDIFLFKKKVKVNIYYEKSKYEKLEILSSMEIENFIKKKKKDINLLYFKNIANKNIKYKDKVKDLGYYIENDLEIREKKKLDNLKLDEPFSKDKDYSPKQYSKYFYKYFIYEDINEQNKKIIYEQNDIRSNILYNILELRGNDSLKTYKFTGPSSIGKSFTLLRISRIFYNIAYINLKAINDCSNNLFEMYSIIISELERFDIEGYLEELNLKIQDNYNNNNNYLALLLDIMEFLNNIKSIGKTFVFILDQFKSKYINKSFLERIKQFDKIKIVQCSSINDKIIRTECIDTWVHYGYNFIELNKDSQNYYFYYSKIYDLITKIKGSNDNDDDEIFRQFSYLPKYVYKYKKEKKTKNKFLKDIKNHIDEKIEEFCKSHQIEKSLMLSKLKYIIREEFDYEKLNTIIHYCPLKYFIVYFKEYTFKIRPIFPFMLNVIIYKLKESECDEYFKKEKYKKDSIVNDYVKGDYFEASVKFGLLNLQLPKNEGYQIITLNEIVSMDKIIFDNDYFEEFDDEEQINENKIEYINVDNQKEKLDALINNNTGDEGNEISEIESVKILNENYNYSESFEEEEKEEHEINNETNIENIEENNIKNENKDEENGFKNEQLKSLLDKFGIEIKKNKSIEDGLSSEVISFSKGIEDYRIDEIERQKNQTEKIEKCNFKGNESIFLDQFSKWGKALDFAYLYGEQKNKIFVGFQIKCYFENSVLKNNAINRCWIKKQCQKILVNSLKLFNCKITKWFYFLVFYYNSQIKNENINIENLVKCKKNDISYFFYEPIQKKFYFEKRHNLNIMKKLEVDIKANLDNYIINVENFYNFTQLGNIKIGKNLLEMRESFIEDFSSVFQKKEPQNIFDIYRNIRANITDLNKFDFYFYSKTQFNKSFICPPNRKFVLFYKKKNSNDYIASFTKNGIVKYHEVSTGKEIFDILGEIDPESEYYYCLNRIKRKKISFPKINFKKAEKIPFFK